MKLTVLGNCGPFEGPGKACSGYLLEHNSYKILLDCGNGVLGELQKYCRLDELTHIILSHLHYDHMSDMMVLRYAVDIKRKRGSLKREISLYLPNEPKAEYEKIIASNIFAANIISEDLKLALDDLCISFKMMNHPVKCFATKVELNKKKFIYTGDTGVVNDLADYVQKADLFLCDAGLLAKDKTTDNPPHLTAYEVGEVAEQAKVKRLLLTHFWPEYDLNEVLDEAKAHYINAELALEGSTYEI